MHPLLDNIFKTKKFTNSKNEIITIHSETSEEQCKFLQDIIYQNNFKHSIEIGIAYGLSTLAITEAIAKNGGKAVALDPFQNDKDSWDGNGLDLILQSGYQSSLEFIKEFSYKALPRFLESGVKFDFAYIDTTKLFDWLMVDFFYIDKILEIGGVIVFDDLAFPSIKKLLRYLSQLPHYEVYGQVPANRKLSSIRKILIKPFVPGFALKEELRLTDYKLGVGSNCVALRKLGNDERNYDWHRPF